MRARRSLPSRLLAVVLSAALVAWPLPRAAADPPRCEAADVATELAVLGHERNVMKLVGGCPGAPSRAAVVSRQGTLARCPGAFGARLRVTGETLESHRSAVESVAERGPDARSGLARLFLSALASALGVPGRPQAACGAISTAGAGQLGRLADRLEGLQSFIDAPEASWDGSGYASRDLEAVAGGDGGERQPVELSESRRLGGSAPPPSPGRGGAAPPHIQFYSDAGIPLRRLVDDPDEGRAYRRVSAHVRQALRGSTADGWEVDVSGLPPEPSAARLRAASELSAEIMAAIGNRSAAQRGALADFLNDHARLSAGMGTFENWPALGLSISRDGRQLTLVRQMIDGRRSVITARFGVSTPNPVRGRPAAAALLAKRPVDFDAAGTLTRQGAQARAQDNRVQWEYLGGRSRIRNVHTQRDVSAGVVSDAYTLHEVSHRLERYSDPAGRDWREVPGESWEDEAERVTRYQTAQALAALTIPDFPGNAEMSQEWYAQTARFFGNLTRGGRRMTDSEALDEVATRSRVTGDIESVTRLWLCERAGRAGDCPRRRLDADLSEDERIENEAHAFMALLTPGARRRLDERAKQLRLRQFRELGLLSGMSAEEISAVEEVPVDDAEAYLALSEFGSGTYGRQSNNAFLTGMERLGQAVVNPQNLLITAALVGLAFTPVGWITGLVVGAGVLLGVGTMVYEGVNLATDTCRGDRECIHERQANMWSAGVGTALILAGPRLLRFGRRMYERMSRWIKGRSGRTTSTASATPPPAASEPPPGPPAPPPPAPPPPAPVRPSMAPREAYNELGMAPRRGAARRLARLTRAPLRELGRRAAGDPAEALRLVEQEIANGTRAGRFWEAVRTVESDLQAKGLGTRATANPAGGAGGAGRPLAVQDVLPRPTPRTPAGAPAETAPPGGSAKPTPRWRELAPERAYRAAVEVPMLHALGDHRGSAEGVVVLPPPAVLAPEVDPGETPRPSEPPVQDPPQESPRAPRPTAPPTTPSGGAGDGGSGGEDGASGEVSSSGGAALGGGGGGSGSGGSSGGRGAGGEGASPNGQPAPENKAAGGDDKSIDASVPGGAKPAPFAPSETEPRRAPVPDSLRSPDAPFSPAHVPSRSESPSVGDRFDGGRGQAPVPPAAIAKGLPAGGGTLPSVSPPKQEQKAAAPAEEKTAAASAALRDRLAASANRSGSGSPIVPDDSAGDYAYTTLPSPGYDRRFPHRGDGRKSGNPLKDYGAEGAAIAAGLYLWSKRRSTWRLLTGRGRGED